MGRGRIDKRRAGRGRRHRPSGVLCGLPKACQSCFVKLGPIKNGTQRHGAARRGKYSGVAVAMPSLIRFIVFCGVIAGLGYGGLFALANFVKPEPREMTVRVDIDQLR